MLLPLLVAMGLLCGSVLFACVTMSLVLRMVVRMIRRGSRQPGFWKITAAMAIFTFITAAGHLTQIALWTAAFLLCGEFSDFETAFYFSAQNFTSLGYGDIVLSPRWRLLGPLEAINSLLLFGLSTAVLLAIQSHLITNLHPKIMHRGERGVNQEPPSVAE